MHYRAVVDGEARDAVATRIAGVDLARAGRQRRYAELARKAAPRAVAPARFDAELGALVTWLPFDPRLPALAEERGELERRLGDAASRPSPSWSATSRAPARCCGPTGCVLKAYGAPRQFEAALAGLRAATAGPLRTGAFAGALPGAAADRAAGRRGPAARVGGARSRARRARSPPSCSARRIDGLARRAARAPPRAPRRARRSWSRRVLPELRPRVEALLERLGRELPAGLALVPAHGDFHVDQLLVAGDGIAVVDFDEMCLAAPALDIASYAADVVRGRDGDLAAVGEVLERPARRLRRPAGGARLAPRGRDPRPRRAPLPPPGPRLARAGRRRCCDAAEAARA